MLSRVVTGAIKRRRIVLLAAGMFFLFCGAIGGNVADKLSSNGGFADPRSDSLKAANALQSMGSGAPGLLFLVTPQAGNVDSPQGAAEGEAFTRAIQDRAVASGGFDEDVLSYWNTGINVFRSKDHKHGLVIVRMTIVGDKAISQAATIRNGLAAEAARDGVTIQTGGPAAVFAELGETVKKDLVKADSIAIPITGILLVLIFGSAVAAMLPLVVGLLSVVGSLAALRILVLITPVSVYAANLATAIGLGLGIDYGLFVVTRYREELATGKTPSQAALRSIQTAGRTVLFSALTVAAALAALLVFPLFFLRSFGYAGVFATLFAATAAIIVLPALLVAWAKWLDKFDLRKPVRRMLRLGPPPPAGLTPPDGGIWRRIATVVMKRPVLFGGAAVTVLVLAGLPFLGVRFGLPDDRALAPNAASHQAMAAIEHDLGLDSTDLIVAVTTSPPVELSKVADYQKTLSLLPDAKTVQGPAGVYQHGKQTSVATPILQAQFDLWGGNYVSVTPTVLGYTPRGEALVRAVRAVPSPYPVTLVGGNGASLIDTEHSIGSTLPLAGAIMAAVTLLVLFLFTGSVVLPVKAIIMTLLSLSATFGLMVWGFQEGHLASVLDFQKIGYLDTSVPILMFCVVFGLSMDYEVFLLSRIKEEYDRTGDNEHSVALGLEKTGRLVSSAALLLAVVFIAFASSGVEFIKLLGVGSCVAVILDATIVRGILVPSFMRLAGDWNWWAPKPLKKVYDRIGLKETVDEEPAVVEAPSRPYPSMAPGPVVREGDHVWRRFDLAEELWMHPRRPTERPQPPVPAEADAAIDLRESRPRVIIPADADDHWPVASR